MEQPELRILHYTEILAGGILTLLRVLTSKQSEEGAEVHVRYRNENMWGGTTSIKGSFESPVNVARAPLKHYGSRITALPAEIRYLRGLYRSGGYDVVHLHSSFAGVSGRLAGLGLRHKPRIFYSPHGFAFCMDKSPLTLIVLRRIEKILKNLCQAVVLSSPSELRLAQFHLNGSELRMLQNSFPVATVSKRTLVNNSRIRIGTIGRIAQQKAPWQFNEVANMVTDAEFVWGGGGDKIAIEKWLVNTEIEVTGWLSPPEVDEFLQNIDIFLLTSKYEGLSFALIQAQVAGIPAIVSQAVGNVDGVLDGETGFICEDTLEMAFRISQLNSDREKLHQMSMRAREWASKTFDDTKFGQKSLEIYASFM